MGMLDDIEMCQTQSQTFYRILASSGFDVIQPLKVSWYNDYLIAKGLATDSTSYLEDAGEQHVSGSNFTLSHLPDYGRGKNALAFIVGNSKAMWPCFLRWLKQQPDPAMKDPIDTYAAQAINAAAAEFAEFAGTTKFDIFWSADLTPERLVDMNRAALVAGLCSFSEDMFLSVHPVFGSWVAFRAVIVFDLDASHLGDRPEHLPSPLTEEEAENARAAFHDALQASSQVEMSVNGMPLHLAHKWAAMRDCVGIGQGYKYSDRQSEYHCAQAPSVVPARAYPLLTLSLTLPHLPADTKDPALLVAAMAELPESSEGETAAGPNPGFFKEPTAKEPTDKEAEWRVSTADKADRNKESKFVL